MSSNNIYIISDYQRSTFKPTYLYIKQHSITGLKYFGKTTRNPLKYKGSGSYWKLHIKKHGIKFVETIWYKLFTDIDELSKYALQFSIDNNIIDSNEYANLIYENGLFGGDSLLATTNNNKRVSDGTHPFLQQDFQKNIQLTLSKNGTHHFLGGEVQGNYNRKLVANKEHHFCDSEKQRELSLRQFVNGTNIFLDGTFCRGKASREIYKEIKALFKQLNLKIPAGTYMKSDLVLEDLKHNLSKLL
jgi:hypothetical protein